ncbi:MAG: hypothetical protein WA290_23885 [Mycobacterium sp.]
MATRFDPDTALGAELSCLAHSAQDTRGHRSSNGYDAGVQPPPPGFPPQWGSSPNEPGEHVEPGYSGQPGPERYDPQPPHPGYGAPSPGPAYPPPVYGQQPGYGPPAWGGYGAPGLAPTSQQAIGWITFAVIGLLGLLGAVLTLTLWINLNSAVSRASDVCNRYSGEYSSICRQHVKQIAPSVPMALVICLSLIIGASLAASGGAVMLFLKKQLGQFLILGGGIVMLVLAIGCEARYGTTGRVTYDLIAGLVVAVTAGLMFVPAFRVILGLPRKLTGGPGPGGFAGGGQWPHGQPQPPQYGPPGPG